MLLTTDTFVALFPPTPEYTHIEADNNKTLGGTGFPNYSRPSTPSSCANSVNDWDDSADGDGDGGDGGRVAMGGGRPKTAAERAKAKRRREVLTKGKVAHTGTRKSSSAPPRRIPAGGKIGERGGGGGGGGKGGLGGQRRMFSDDGEDSSSTEEETSSDEEVRDCTAFLLRRGGVLTHVCIWFDGFRFNSHVSALDEDVRP